MTDPLMPWNNMNDISMYSFLIKFSVPQYQYYNIKRMSIINLNFEFLIDLTKITRGGTRWRDLTGCAFLATRQIGTICRRYPTCAVSAFPLRQNNLSIWQLPPSLISKNK